MIELIGGLWLASLFLSFLITASNVHYATKLSRSLKYKTLNYNLKKVGLYWNLNNESFTELGHSSPEAEAQKSIRSYIYLALLGLLSILGLFLLIITSYSLRELAKSRLTVAVFKSELTKNKELTAEQVRAFITEIQQQHP